MFDEPVSGHLFSVMLLHPPGVYRAEDDTDLLIDVMRRGDYALDRQVLDIGTGSGALAIAAAKAGAATVTAIDLSLRAVAATWLNSRLQRAPVSVRRGDLFAPVAGRRFDLVVANPPYVPSEGTVLPRHRIARSWDAGPDGRALLDRICADVPDFLAPDGDLLLVHSELCGTQETLDALAAAGLRGRVLAKANVPFGPVLRARAAMLEARGMIYPGQRIEKLVVVGARHA
ncbi:MAG: methyltransferase [Actinomycetota bacterium]|nr:methyltransferase [Actinomycetota bacterium]